MKTYYLCFLHDFLNPSCWEIYSLLWHIHFTSRLSTTDFHSRWWSNGAYQNFLLKKNLFDKQVYKRNAYHCYTTFYHMNYCFLCLRRDSNPHGLFCPQEFRS